MFYFKSNVRAGRLRDFRASPASRMTTKPSSDQLRTISRHSLAYVLASISELFRHYDFDPTDLLIIHTVMSANVLAVMRNPELDRQFGSIHTVEPDGLKKGVSRGTVSRFLNLPIETVRRRVDRLKNEGVLSEPDGLIVAEANAFNFGNNHELQKINVDLIRKLLHDLAQAGVEVPGGV
jgi:hypothetical protein